MKVSYPASTHGIRQAMKASVGDERAEAEALRKSWADRLARAKPEDRPRVESACAAERLAHTEKIKHRGHLRAAMITSAPDWVPVAKRAETPPPKSPEQKAAREAATILTEGYRLLGLKGRALAEKRGEAFAEKHVEAVKLDKSDVDAIVAQLEDASPKARERAHQLLARHIFHEDGAGRCLATKEARVYARTVIFDVADADRELDLELHLDKLEAAERKNQLNIDEKREVIDRFVEDARIRERRDAKNRWRGPVHDLRKDKSKAGGQRSIETRAGVAVLVIKD
jgi:hypothetical protein